MGRDAARRALVAAGLLLSAWMALRAQVGGDQLNLLARGWLWAARGELVPYGNPLSSGGNGPGALTTVVVGAPLFVWMDHRAPVALVWLSHLAAFLLLDRILARHLSAGERLAFVAVYWLNPWRLEPSAFLWNPNLLFLAGAVHFATAWASRERASWAMSALHVLTLGLAFQLHPGTLLLAALSALLWLRGYARVHWGGVALGALAVGATLLPWLAAARANPGILAVGEGFPLRGLVYLFPLVKGMFYLLRYPSLALNTQTTRFDFTEALGAGADRWLTPAAKGLLGVAGVVTAVAAAWALWVFFRSRRPLARWPPERGESRGRSWLEGYSALAFAGALAVFALAPTTPQAWQALPIFHAAVLPAVFAVGRLEAAGRALLARRAITGYAALALLANLALALAGPNFRCAGRGTLVFPLASHSAMFDELGIQRTCPWPLDRPGTWWPDVLPREGAAEGTP